MEVSITYEIADTVELNPDRLRELKAFDDSKAGVKGLVDEGVTKIPTLFHHPRDEFVKASTLGYTKHIIPVVDLSEVGKELSYGKHLRNGVVNSGIPVMFPEDFKDGVQRIYKQDNKLITNDRFKSVEHRVLANLIGPRILCIACFFSVGLKSSPKLYGPIKDLLSEDNHPKYRETTVAEYARYCQKNKVENT
ncbi:1-aminocyclopropane-1-carboxylate oxidase 1 [Glycine max]|nr:1-aminocyclopropane-1-carboxylate oxidase 1 [Glycine max]